MGGRCYSVLKATRAINRSARGGEKGGKSGKRGPAANWLDDGLCVPSCKEGGSAGEVPERGQPAVAHFWHRSWDLHIARWIASRGRCDGQVRVSEK
jgi:hypothetical protein